MDNIMFEKAQAALKNCYVKYSNFHVGAALKMKDGTILTGVNIENASYGLSNCAERTALFSAYAQGYTKDDIEAVLVTTKQSYFVSPCGACRQVMNELVHADVPVTMTDKDGNAQTLLNRELLPLGFSGDDL